MTFDTFYIIMFTIIVILWFIRAGFTFTGRFFGGKKHKETLSQSSFRIFCTISAASDMVFGIGWFFIGIFQTLAGLPDRVLSTNIALICFIVSIFLGGLANRICYKKWILLE